MSVQHSDTLQQNTGLKTQSIKKTKNITHPDNFFFDLKTPLTYSRKENGKNPLKKKNEMFCMTTDKETSENRIKG